MEEEQIIDRRSEVYDLETLRRCFTYTGINIDTLEINIFVIHKERNDLVALVTHLKSLKGQIGFNNLNFDYPIIHFILLNYNRWLNIEDSQLIVDEIYAKAQTLINNQNQENFFPAIKEKEVLINQLDLFKVWHFDNVNRSTSLKGLEISMNYPNVMDMPIHHGKDTISLEEIDQILEYNLNDVLATKLFYDKSLEKIDLRKKLISKYNLSCINYSDSKIGEELMLKLYCEATNNNPYDVKKLRSYRSLLKFKDCIPNYIKFNSREFNNLLEYLKSIEVSTLKDSFEYTVLYKGFGYDLGTGGIHGASKAGIYSENELELIKDSDVGSLYPSLGIANGLYPEHLGEIFYTIYEEDIVKARMKAKKEKDMVMSDGLKLSANSVYGKSNSSYSFLYDPLYTLKTTLAGQLSLCMLAERLVDNIPDIEVIQINTDGITTKYNRKYDDLYDQICQQWESETKLNLEHAFYSKVIMRDVNNYIAVYDNGKIKYKGCFEIDKVVGSEPAYNKDNSFRVVPIALSDYFVKGIPIEHTIYNHKNIYDFCGRQKFGKDSHGEIHYMGDNNQIIVEPQQKNVRYYISKSGKIFVKQYSKGDSEMINKGYQVEIFNKYIEKEFKDYNIDYTFYIKEANKIINVVDNKQLQLF